MFLLHNNNVNAILSAIDTIANTTVQLYNYSIEWLYTTHIDNCKYYIDNYK